MEGQIPTDGEVSTTSQSDLTPAPEPTPSSEKRLTVQDAEQAKTEKKVAFSELMDSMESSVSEQGQYFVRLGEKTEDSDSRVLILRDKTPADNPVDSKRLLVTRGGILELTQFSTSNAFGEKLSGIVNDLMSGKEADQMSGLYGDGAAIRFALKGDRGVDQEVGKAGLNRFRGTTEDFQGHVKRSIDMTEPPHKKNVENARAQAEIAKSASSMIKGLPPRE